MRSLAAVLALALGGFAFNAEAQFGGGLWQTTAGGNLLTLDGKVHANAAPVASLTIAGVGITNGDLVIVASTSNDSAIASVSSPHVTAYTLRASFDASNANNPCTTTVGARCLEVWSGTANATSATEAITITNGAGTTYQTVDAFAIKNQAGYDANGSLPNITQGANAIISTSNANDWLLAYCRQSSTATPTAGTGYTAVSGADFQIVEFKPVTATQAGVTVATGAGSGDVGVCFGDAVKSN